MKPSTHTDGGLGAVWIKSTPSLVSVALESVFKRSGARVYRGPRVPQGADAFSVVAYIPEGEEDLSSGVGRLKKLAPDASIVIFAASEDLSLARAAVLAGADGFLHAGMPPEQVARALKKARDGEEVMPRELLMRLVSEMAAKEREPDLSSLGPRKMEILEMVTEGLSNAEIGRRLYLSESTVKQHLRAAYKTLGIMNRTQAARLVRSYRSSEANGMR